MELKRKILQKAKCHNFILTVVILKAEILQNCRPWKLLKVQLRKPERSPIRPHLLDLYAKNTWGTSDTASVPRPKFPCLAREILQTD